MKLILVSNFDESSMERILERYERYSYVERQLTAPDPESHQNWHMELAKLKARLEVLQRNQRHYMGEDLDTLSLKELQNLEQQLDAALRHVRSKKNQLMYESISQLQKKHKALQEQNNLLAKTVKAKEKEKGMAQQGECDRQDHDLNPSPFLLSHSFPSLNIGGSSSSSSSSNNERGTQAPMPSWMLPT
ncbi:Agamous-like MADS-box protein ap1 [Ancistrocladus abbreviatus]